MNEMMPIMLAVLSSAIGAVGAVMLKRGSAGFTLNPAKLIRNRNIVGGVIVYAFSKVIFVYAMKSSELSILYPVVSTGYIWSALLSVKLLGENMNGHKLAGIALIILGVSLIGAA